MDHRILCYPGSKWKTAPWIIDKMGAHHSYLEPFFGSGAVFFKKPKSKIETINDLNGEVVNLFEIIRNCPEKLANAIRNTPYAREEYRNAYDCAVSDKIEKARRFLVKSWQGYGYRMNEYPAGWKRDVQGREAAYAVRDFNRIPDRIMEAAQRLKDAQIECKPAVELIRDYNYSNVLIYADPPYLHSTRAKGKQYANEMNDQEHIELLMALNDHKGKALISGYDSDLHNQMLPRDIWQKYSIDTRDQATNKRTEILWVKD